MSSPGSSDPPPGSSAERDDGETDRSSSPEATDDAAAEEPAAEQATDEHVTVLRDGDRAIHIVGTAHVSRRSVEEVRRVIERVRPDTVCVELCKTRYEALVDETRWQKLDIFQVIRQRKILFLLASLALQAFQRRLGDKLGVRPGEELLEGVRAAEDVGAEVVLADRDVQATLRRTWANVSWWNKLKLVSGLFAAMFEREDVDEEQVEALKDRDYISDMLAELAEVMPEVKQPLIDERDQYLMSSVEDAPGETVVAVVGAGHVEGMVEHQGKGADREALSVMPRPSLLSTAIKWLIPIIILAAFYRGYTQHEAEGLKEMVFAWILPNAVAAGLFTLIAGGKLLSVAVSIVASPITSLNPTIGAGMVVGLVEAWLRRPTVKDCERLSDDMTTLRGAHRNPFSRILIVALAATLGSALGAWIGATWVLTLL
jgi:pheromone shutdown-related protein TraB